MLVCAVLFMLAATAQLPDSAIVPAVVILLRELLISGLREFLAGLQISLPVSRLAKWKTTIQLGAIAILIVGEGAGPLIAASGSPALWLAAMLTVASGWDYLQTGLRHMAEPFAKP
ncbi:hypothetical protein CCP1ISM_8930001 [Azospirillaceae bacterium]